MSAVPLSLRPFELLRLFERDGSLSKECAAILDAWRCRFALVSLPMSAVTDRGFTINLVTDDHHRPDRGRSVKRDVVRSIKHKERARVQRKVQRAGATHPLIRAYARYSYDRNLDAICTPIRTYAGKIIGAMAPRFNGVDVSVMFRPEMEWARYGSNILDQHASRATLDVLKEVSAGKFRGIPKQFPAYARRIIKGWEAACARWIVKEIKRQRMHEPLFIERNSESDAYNPNDEAPDTPDTHIENVRPVMPLFVDFSNLPMPSAAKESDIRALRLLMRPRSTFAEVAAEMGISVDELQRNMENLKRRMRTA